MARKSSHTGLKQIIRPRIGQIIGITCLMILQSLLQVSMALVTRYVIDAAIYGKNLLFWAVLLCVNILALIGIHSLLAWQANTATDKMNAQLRGELMKNAVYSRDVRLQDYRSGELLSRGMEDVQAVCDGVINALPTLAGQLASLLAAFAVVIILHPMVALVMCVVSLFVGLFAAWLRPAIKRRQRLVRQQESLVTADMQEDLQQLELIQSIGAQQQVLGRFDRRQQESLFAKFKRRILSVGSNSTIAAASQLGTGALLLWGGAQVAQGALTYGALTALIQLFNLFRGPVLSLSGVWTRLASVEVSGERLAELLYVPEETGRTEAEEVTAIVFENVTFAYPREEAPVLENFSIRFPLDGWACLTGISGKGKSTMFKLILGLYTPSSGRVYLQTDNGEIPCSEQTRHLFSYVPQDYALLSGTIEENLRLVAPEATDEELKNALNIAGCGFVWDLTEQMQTALRENTGLSKGQLQRVAIARAVLMNRPILLLDECTSALDSQTEKQLLQNLQKVSRQAILVTHRPDALEELSDIHPVSI